MLRGLLLGVEETEVVEEGEGETWTGGGGGVVAVWWWAVDVGEDVVVGWRGGERVVLGVVDGEEVVEHRPWGASFGRCARALGRLSETERES